MLSQKVRKSLVWSLAFYPLVAIALLLAFARALDGWAMPLLAAIVITVFPIIWYVPVIVAWSNVPDEKR